MTRCSPGALAAVVGLGLGSAGCPSAQTGTIELELATAPGSTLMSSVTRLRVTVTRPRAVFEVARTEHGFDLSLDLEATGISGSLVVEGLDAAGGLVLAGESPPFPFAAIDAHIVIYVAPPMSLGRAPAPLAPARTRCASVALANGAVIAGGVDAAGAPVDALQIYNAYDHTLTSGLPLPAPRVGVTAAVGANRAVFLFGGRDAAAAITSTLWRFDPIAPSGAYSDLGEFPELARTDQRAVPLGGDRFLITGRPVAELGAARLTARTDIAGATTGDAVVASDRVITGLFQDEQDAGKLLRFRQDAFDTLALQRPGATIVALSNGRFGVIGGATPEIVVIDAATGELTPAGQMAAPRSSPIAAVTPRFVAVIGADRNLQVFAADTLAPVAVVPNTDDFDAAIALPNEQILFVGATLQLFTPPPPPE